jgi:hypothetical protein
MKTNQPTAITRNTESRNLQSKWIKSVRKQGFRTIHKMFTKSMPSGFRYLCGFVYTNAPHGTNVNS